MNMNQQIGQEIRDVLSSETDAISLSDKLFSSHGLVNQLAKTESERRTVAQAPLFKESQRRFSELKRRNAEKFSNSIEQSNHDSAGTNRLGKIERA